MTGQPEDPTPPARGQPEADAGLLSWLEPGQFAADTTRPVPRAQLSRRARAGLWLLRIFAVIVSGMVIYTFVSQLHS
jgi:hypothetical protein